MPNHKKDDLNYVEVSSAHPALNSEIARLHRCLTNPRILRPMQPARTMEGYSFSMEPYFPDEGEGAGIVLGIEKQGSRSGADSISILVTEDNRVAVRRGGKWVVEENDTHTSESADQLRSLLKKFADILERSDSEDPSRTRSQVGKEVKKLMDF